MFNTKLLKKSADKANSRKFRNKNFNFCAIILTILIRSENSTTNQKLVTKQIYPQCPNLCQCDDIARKVKCNPLWSTNSFARKTILPSKLPLGIKLNTVNLWLENFNFLEYPTKDLSKYRYLKLLTIRNSNITRISPLAFSQIKGIRVIDLSSNNINYIPDELFNLPELKLLELSKNRIQQISSSVFHVLASLKQKDSFPFSTAFPNVFGKEAPNLVQINLSNNILTNITNTTFAKCRNLKVLDLSHNLISSIESHAFHKTPRLMRLKLDFNALNNDNANGLTYGHSNILPNLQQLDLSNNNFSHLPSHLPSGLKDLKLSNNRIRTIGKTDCWNYGTELNLLALNGNNLTFIEVGAFLNYKQLNKIWLNNNSLHEIPLLPISLSHIYLQDNKIGRTNKGYEFFEMSNLTKLSLQNNFLEEIQPETFSFPALCCSNLTSLSLHQNKLAVLHENQFSGLKALKFLGLSANPLQITENSCFAGMPSLSVLKLNNIGASWIQPSDIHNMLVTISSINVENQGGGETQNSVIVSSMIRKEYTKYHRKSQTPFNLMFDTLQLNLYIFREIADTVEIMTMAQSPKLVSNLLFGGEMRSTVSPTVFKNLREIDLDDNNLTRIPIYFNQMFPSLTQIHLNCNKWHCDRKIIYLLRMLHNSNITFVDSEKLVCSTPKSLKGKRLVDLNATEIASRDAEIKYLNQKTQLSSTIAQTFFSKGLNFNWTSKSDDTLLFDNDSSDFNIPTRTTNMSSIDLYRTTKEHLINLTRKIESGTSKVVSPSINTNTEPNKVKPIKVNSYKGPSFKLKKDPRTWLAITGILSITLMGILLLLFCGKYEPWKLLKGRRFKNFRKKGRVPLNTSSIYSPISCSVSLNSSYNPYNYKVLDEFPLIESPR